MVVDDYYYYYYIIYVHFISFFEVRVNAVRVSVSDHVHRSLERDGFFFFLEKNRFTCERSECGLRIRCGGEEEKQTHRSSAYMNRVWRVQN